MHIHPEMPDSAQRAHLLRRKPQLRQVAPVLADGPEGLAGIINGGLVPAHQLLGRRDVLGNGLFGQDMFACEEGFPDEFRLDEDREAAGLLV